jgi:Protein of unknown function (DUF1592)/Protein of unknown function (DUF1588)/Protein of unknown function (DUF1595)/Protein of unknown function (DUF1587)/Protein of unknown function (DUF1585)
MPRWESMKSSFDPPTEMTRPAFPIARLLAHALIWGATACSSEIGDLPGGPGRGAGVPAASGGASGTGGSGSGAGGGSGSGPSFRDSGTSPPPAPVDPGTKGVHRLNSTEYNATVADVLGTKLEPANSSWRGGEIGGFDNMAAVLDVDDAQFKRYFDAAGLVADDVFAAADLKAKIVTCATTDDVACVQSIVTGAGRRLFRRPLGPDEVATYGKVYTLARQQGEDHDGSIKQVLRSLLSSAEFLYRIETDPIPSSNEKHPLGAYELASRLSYFLWSSAPDDALLAAAADDSLTRDDVLGAAVDRMLSDATKSARFVRSFAGQWLGARKLPEHAASPSVYPSWSPQLASSLTSEMYLYFTEFLRSDRSWLEFLEADVNFVDATLASFYGVPAPAGNGQQRVEIKTDQRFGFFGLGGFLALSSVEDRTSPTLRGRWILTNLLCTEPPPPPPGIPELTAGTFDPTKNVAKALEEHRKNPACAGCHRLFDPYGLSLEQFDGIGKHRTAYADGATIDPTTELGGVTFTGIRGLADTVTKNPTFTACIADTMFTYGLGRVIADTDRPYLAAVQAEWKQGTPTLRRLIRALVLAETFRYRHGAK